jgi:hypothetical protein
MSEIAAASHRNVIESEDVVAKLYASAKVLNTTTATLVTNFKDVGYETSQIGVNLEESVEYIQSVGLNAVTVMKSVSDNMAQMNRFQFEGGVQGLAKMAAQASMLRFDMKQTFDLANRVLDPEGAIDTAAAFQRLGVSVGNLADPFQLMNQSINDPSGLQDSLADVAKSFTYFDEKTQSFKINPQGVLTLREMEKQTGVSAAEMSKMGLAAADLDRRLSQVKTAGLKFANEEDKQYLANIAKMDGGTYKVTLEDGTKKELADLTQPEFDKLIEQQKNAPKTMEDIQKSQLGATKSMESDIRAIKDKMYLGGVSSQAANIEGLRSVVTGFASNAQKMVPESNEMRKGIADAVGNMQNVLAVGMKDGFKSVSFKESIDKMKETLLQKGSNMDDKTFKVIQDLAKQTATGLRGNSQVEQMFKEAILGKTGSPSSPSKTANLKNTQTKPQPLTREQIMGVGTASKNYNETLSQQKEVNSQVNFGGTITIDVKTPSGVSQQEFKTYFESEEFKKKVYEYYKEKAKELEKR